MSLVVNHIDDSTWNTFKIQIQEGKKHLF